MIPVLLSGGSGTRLWPVSRSNFPKQFCEIFEETLQSKTILRLLELCQDGNQPWIVTSHQLKNLTEGQIKNLRLKPENILYEPQGRNTAPAIAFLCHELVRMGLGKEVVGVFPSDHLIQKEKEFYRSVEFAEEIAREGRIVTLGIKPTYPEVGYGYIQMTPRPLKENGELTAHTVKKFHEKPDLARAKTFIQSNFFCWNAGIFIFQVEQMVTCFQKHQPAMWQAFQSLKADLSNLTEVYSRVENISLDYAILEKLSENQLACVPADIGWSDVGSWDAIFSVKNSQENLQIESQNNFVQGLPEKNYSFIGADDISVVDTKDALLVFRNGQSQKVKDVVDRLKKTNVHLTQDHPFEYRPWGYYEILKDTEHFKSKVIRVAPHSQISYQSHNQREEHWVITRGVGEVVLNDEVIPVKAGSYVKIPLQSKHRIRNTTAEDLEFVEVQLGTYFGEDDIIRYQDDYKRI